MLKNLIVWVRERHVEIAKLPFPVFMVVGEKAWLTSANNSRKKMGAAAPTAVNMLQVSNPVDRCAQGLPNDALASKKNITAKMGMTAETCGVRQRPTPGPCTSTTHKPHKKLKGLAPPIPTILWAYTLFLPP